MLTMKVAQDYRSGALPLTTHTVCSSRTMFSAILPVAGSVARKVQSHATLTSIYLLNCLMFNGLEEQQDEQKRHCQSPARSGSRLLPACGRDRATWQHPF
jgi:hypothetical protein